MRSHPALEKVRRRVTSARWEFTDLHGGPVPWELKPGDIAATTEMSEKMGKERGEILVFSPLPTLQTSPIIAYWPYLFRSCGYREAKKCSSLNRAKEEQSEYQNKQAVDLPSASPLQPGIYFPLPDMRHVSFKP